MIILIEDIKSAKNKNLQIKFEDYIEGIKSKSPIIADLQLTDLGEFIKVSGKVSGTAILECDLCLEGFEHAVDVEVNELFAKQALQEEYSQETELKDGQFVTDLNGSDNIDITDLLYQSVILDFPNKKVCGINCKGGDIFIREEDPAKEEIDPRMAVFKNIKLK